MLDAAGLEKWIAENGTGNKERKYINGIDYLFVTMNDGWIAIFEYSEGYYIPKTQAADEANDRAPACSVQRDMKQRRGSPASFFFFGLVSKTNFIL